MNKKNIEYIFFAILNIITSSFLLGGMALLFIAMLTSCIITDLLSSVIVIEDDFGFSVILSFFMLPIISVLFKIFLFPLIYKIKFLNNIRDFLERFANKKNILKNILLVILFDILVYIISVCFLNNESFLDYIVNFEDSLILYLFVCGGVLPCYLSFLLWNKLTNRKNKEN